MIPSTTSPNSTVEPTSATRPRVVVIGGGFAGLATTRGLAKTDVDITLIDRRNFHLFQPLLYQVATGGLSPAEISAPLRSILARQENVTVLRATVIDFDLENRLVVTKDRSLPFDHLVVATGATHHYFGNPNWELFAPGLKSVEDATRIRASLLDAFERAEGATTAEERGSLLTFVIVGAGPTGVELAGALGELAHWTLENDFRRIDPKEARILLVDGADRVLQSFAPSASKNARLSLERLGVEVWTESLVTEIDSTGVNIQRSGEQIRIDSGAVLWASGVTASPLAAILSAASGVQTTRGGRLPVLPDLTLKDHPNVYVLGDMAALRDEQGEDLPGIAPVAMQQGQHTAKALRNLFRGKPQKDFRYQDKGKLAVIGRASAVAEVGRVKLSGYPAWVLWLFVHILYLAGFANRLLVLFEWGYSYLTRRRGARLITRSAPIQTFDGET